METWQNTRKPKGQPIPAGDQNKQTSQYGKDKYKMQYKI